MRGKRKWVSILATVALLLPLFTMPMTAFGSESANDRLGIMLKEIRAGYQMDEMNQWMVYQELNSIRDRLPDRPVVLDQESEDEESVAQALYQDPSNEQSVTDTLYNDPIDSTNSTDSTDSTDSNSGDPLPEGEVISFQAALDELLTAYEQEVREDAVLENRFVGTRFSRTKLDLYRLLHSYYETYQFELTDDEQKLVLSGMAMLLVVELKQVEAIKGDMNSFMNYLKQKGGRIKSPSETHQEVANRHWDLAMSHLDKGIAVSSFVQLHNSLRKSQHVLELNDMEYSWENLEKDTDSDNVPDLVELQYNTDVQNADTDSDRLTDLFEITYGLHPLHVENAEDPDHDSLTNEQEQKWETDPKDADTDQDRLSDADEVLIHHTDPNKADTDGDRLIDSKEVELALDPLKTDTDGNGLSDMETRVTESVPIPMAIQQKFAEAGAVPEVMVDGQPGAGSLAIIGDAYQVDGMMPGIVGMVGHPIEITSSGKFDKATIKFRLTDRVSRVNIDRLRVMWWDEQNNQMVMLPNQRVDIANKIISAETTHFSRYALVDIDAWSRVWQEGYIPGKPTAIRGRINNFAIAAVYHYREGILFNSGVVDRDSLDQNISRGSLDTESVHNQKFSYQAGSDNFISDAVAALIEDSSLRDKWKILLVASDTKHVDDPNLESAIEQAKRNQIKIFTYWTSNQQGSGGYDIESVAHATDGNFYANDLQLIPYTSEMWREIEQAVLEEEDVDVDGIPDRVERKGILLGTGERIFPSTSIEDRNHDAVPDGQDSDGDGLSDGFELGYMDRDGKAYEKPKIGPVVSQGDLGSRGGALHPQASLYAFFDQGCPPQEDCNDPERRDLRGGTRADNYSRPEIQDSDKDGYNDDVDRHPMDFYKRPIVMLHGINSNGWNVYGAPNNIANSAESQNRIWSDFLFERQKEKFASVQDQKVYDQGRDEDGLYHFLEVWGLDQYGHNLYVHGNNMFVFNYSNLTRFDKNSYLLSDYLDNLWFAEEIESPTWNDTKPKIDLLVHSMGGLVTRYYNEQLTYHPFDINRVVFLATPHLGGKFVGSALKIPFADLSAYNFASAARGLNENDAMLNQMNWESMEYQRTYGAGYYAIGSVNFDKDRTELPQWLQQNGPTSTIYEYWAGAENDYEAQTRYIIGEDVAADMDMADGYVDLNSAMGTYTRQEYYETRHVPFASRWVYIGLYQHAEHTYIHHDDKVKWKTTEILVGGR